MMLTRYPPEGKRVLLTAAGSDCAILLGQWARQAGAEAVYGIHRSPVHAERLEAMGIIPVAQHDAQRIGTVAARADVVYDATGGPLAEAILSAMPEQGMFVCYGLLLRANVQTATARAARGVVPYPKRSGCAQR